ncbi:hypothetical protein [Actinacidiphila sp. ITFR-21]|uniref:hypothetical protein n=1 Tax=Actinacidiphila sp. ITFR-21 TaxID=3075199 RepID=UPI00288A27E8|nr:hypothetical protein [Streptomyces sp. ITFR-21]WNI19373.1 hypothetical protein RLT57_30065 [Streptomyces sp. ITFR-21]
MPRFAAAGLAVAAAATVLTGAVLWLPVGLSPALSLLVAVAVGLIWLRLTAGVIVVAAIRLPGFFGTLASSGQAGAVGHRVASPGNHPHPATTAVGTWAAVQEPDQADSSGYGYEHSDGSPLPRVVLPLRRNDQRDDPQRAVLRYDEIRYDEILFADPVSARVRAGLYDVGHARFHMPSDVAASLERDWALVGDHYRRPRGPES